MGGGISLHTGSLSNGCSGEYKLRQRMCRVPIPATSSHASIASPWEMDLSSGVEGVTGYQEAMDVKAHKLPARTFPGSVRLPMAPDVL